MRTHIAKNLQRRCKAIRSAVKQYNAIAVMMTPPAPTVNWKKVSHFTFLEQFSHLLDNRAELREKPWARPEVREAMRLYRRIDRAGEELNAVYRESRRVHTHVRDEEILFRSALAKAEQERSALLPALREYINYRRIANARNMAYLQHLYGEPGYKGATTPGQRIGATAVDAQDAPELDNDPADVLEDAPDSDDVGEIDDANAEMSGVLEYLASLTL